MRNHTGWLSLFSLLVLALTVLSIGLICHATPSPSPWGERLTKHKWDAIPDNWVSLGQPPNGTTITLHIALKANRENALVDALREVSHPRHPKYGEHLSKEQTAELVAPHPDTLELLFSWLKYNGVPPSSISQTHGGSWLTIVGVPIFQANKLLGASYELYYHAWANVTILRTVSYALPEALHELVQTIVPTTAFTSTRLLQQTRLSDSSREAANETSGEPSDVLSRRNLISEVTPSFLRWLYAMPLDDPDPTDRNKLGIAGFANEFPNRYDLSRFMDEYRSDVDPRIDPSRIITVIPVNGGVDTKGQEYKQANMDTQFPVALTFPTQIEYYTIGGNRHPLLNGPPMDGDQYLEWLQYMIDLENVPQTVSVPYSTRELSLPPDYAYSLCNLFKTLGARGVSVLVASGDEGVGRLVQFPRRDDRFSTTFPASCPYVTSVGGTTAFDPEEGSQRSGGGFSYYFPRPDYQQDAVPPFLDQLGSEHAGYYNPVGRGVPDIALQSMYYRLIWKGEPRFTVTTGSSTNTAAAIITLLNGFRIKNNKHPLGFLNYWLYEAGLYLDGLNDVTLGNNPGCGTDGFYATEGWDPITGLGSLNYTLLAQNLKWSGMK